ncbi:MAG: class I SAM-dependent methyltransferase [Candidatus Bathyarchaeia archaeon]
MNWRIKSILQTTLEGEHFNVCVDLGCGEGYYSETIKKHCKFLIGVDHNLPRLSVAERFGKYDMLVNADIREFPLPNETEAAFMLDVIEHIPKQDGTTLLQKLTTLPNIKLIFISTPLTFTTRGFRNKHVSLWTTEDLQAHGFQTQIITNPFPLSLISKHEIIAIYRKA